MTALTIFSVVVAGVLGLLLGSFLNVVAYRVPAQVSLLRASQCPHCNAAVKPWHNVPVVGWIALGGRCASCNAPISGRYPVVEAVTGLAFAGVTWWVMAGAVSTSTAFVPSVTGWGSGPNEWGFGFLVLGFLYLMSVSVLLTLIDMDTHRLPNAIVLPSYLVGAALLTLASWLGGEWEALLRGAIGMAVLYLFYFALRLIRPDGMGGGDVKLAGVLGLYLGYVGWGALAVGAFAAFVLGGVYGVVLILMRRAGRKSAVPFGPWMIVGAWVGLIAGESIAQAYVGMITT
jgi:leader peptidase (prepilin peptidase)/N-methyltransferase